MTRKQGSTRAVRTLKLITELTAEMPRGTAAKLRRRLAKLIVAAHQTDHQPVPDWLVELKRRA